MKLTNQQIEDAILALDQFNPPVHLRAKMRLSRNLRMLDAARKDKEHDRIRLVHSVVRDKTRKVDAGSSVPLTVEEAEELQAQYKVLMGLTVEVDIHPVEIYDSSDGPQPKDPQIAIDASVIPIEGRILAALWGILVEVEA